MVTTAEEKRVHRTPRHVHEGGNARNDLNRCQGGATAVFRCTGPDLVNNPEPGTVTGGNANGTIFQRSWSLAVASCGGLLAQSATGDAARGEQVLRDRGCTQLPTR